MKETKSGKNLHGIGRRKSSVARVWLKPGTGSIVVNGKSYDTYFDTATAREMVVLPLKIADQASSFDIMVNVLGGGQLGQAGATRLGISRALVHFDERLRSILKQHKLLHCDSRVKERKKYGQRGARRKFQFVKR